MEEELILVSASYEDAVARYHVGFQIGPQQSQGPKIPLKLEEVYEVADCINLSCCCEILYCFSHTATVVWFAKQNIEDG